MYNCRKVISAVHPYRVSGPYPYLAASNLLADWH